MMLVSFLLLLVTPSLSHYFTPLSPLSSLQLSPLPLAWHPWVTPYLNRHIVTGVYVLKHRPLDGLKRVLRGYGVSDNAVNIIVESVQVVNVTLTQSGVLHLVREPGVELAKFPDKVVVSARPGVAVETENPWTHEEAQFRWGVLSPSSVQISLTGDKLVESSVWTFSPAGIQSRTVLTKEGRLVAVSLTFWERQEAEEDV